jgi:hypothetical protein
LLGRGEGGEEEVQEEAEMHHRSGDGDGTVTMWFLVVGGGC